MFPRTIGSWITYGRCGLVVFAGTIGHAFGGLLLAMLLGVPLIVAAFLLQLVNLPSRWIVSRRRSLLPLAACAFVFPAIGTFGPRLLVARFHWHRAQYEAIADAIRAGRHSESLDAHERALAHWFKAMHAGELDENAMPIARSYSASTDLPPRSDYPKVVGVHFLTVTQGFSAHAGFMRVYDPEAAGVLDRGHGADGWSFSKRVTDNWYLVAD